MKFRLKFWKHDDVKTIFRLAKKYIKPQLKVFIFAIFLMIVVAGTTSLYAFLVRDVMDQIFLKKDKTMLAFLPFVVMVITFVKNIALYFQTFLMQVFSARITTELQKDVFAGLIGLDLKKFNKMHTASMLAIIMQSTNAISSGLNIIFTVLIREVLTVIFLMSVMIYQNPTLSMLSLVVAPIIFIPLRKITKKIRKIATSSLFGNQNFASIIDDNLKSIRLIKTYGTEEYEKVRVNDSLEALFKLKRKMAHLGSLSGPLIECISVIGVALVIWYGGNGVINGTTTPGTFFAFFISMTLAYKPFKSITNINVTIQSFLIASKQFFDILDADPEIRESETAVEVKNLKGKIEFKNVSFGYTDDVETLKNINFVIKPNQKIAFVGPTGAGKSTIVSLIMRLYDVNNGKILLDNINIKDVKFKTLRNEISYVGQDVQLFDDTILNNIKYSKLDATENEVIEAATMANAIEFINKMPEGLHSKIGQSGVNLSGGQKQRLSIARAILKNSKVIILDEPTSALDAISEELIKKALEKITHNKTLIIIAHRLSTVIDSDTIYVVENGEITESGIHSDLVKQNGHYATLYKTQFKIS